MVRPLWKTAWWLDGEDGQLEKGAEEGNKGEEEQKRQEEGA